MLNEETLELKKVSPEVGDICIFSNEDTLEITDETVKDCMVCTSILDIGTKCYQANFHTYYTHCIVIKKNKINLERTPLSCFDYDEVLMWLKSRIAYLVTFVYPGVLSYEDIPNYISISKYADWVTSHIDNIEIKDTDISKFWQQLHTIIFTDMYLDWLLPRLQFRYKYILSKLECIRSAYDESAVLDADNIDYYSDETLALTFELNKVAKAIKNIDFECSSASKIYEE